MKEKKATNDVSERLKVFCEARGLSQNGFGKMADLSPAFVKTFTGNPQPGTRKKIQDAFPELNMEWLLGGIGEMLLPAAPKFDNVKNTGSGNIAGRDVVVNPFEGSQRHIELLQEVAELRAKLEASERTVERLEKIIDKLTK